MMKYIKDAFRTIKKKAVAALLLVSVGAAFLTGCHGSKEMADFTVPDSFDTTKPIEIVFWAKNDTNARQTAIYEKAVEDFEALYPNVTVTIRLYNDYGKIYNDVITNIATGTTPNICITYPDHIATYLTSENQVLCLDDIMYDEKYGLGGSELKYEGPSRADMIDKYLNEGRIGEHYYALPYMRSTEALYINKTYVEKLGYDVPDVVTWDYIWEVSEAAMKKDADDNFVINGQNVMIPFIYKSTDNMMIQMLRQQNAGYSTASGEVLLFNDNTREILEEISKHSATKAFSTFKISSYPANFLNAGQCIFAVDSTAGSTWMGPDAPLSDICSDDIISGIEVVVRPIPQFDVSNPVMISQGPSICVFNKADPQEVLASWMFAQFLLTDEVQIAYAETEGYIPVTSKAQNNAEYTDYLSRSGEDNDTYYSIKIETTRLLLNNIDNTFVTPVFNGSASVRDAAGQLIEKTVTSTRRKQAIDDAYFDELYDSIESLYRLDQIEGGGRDGAVDLGPLPTGAKALLITIAVVWCGIIIYVGRDYFSKRKKTGNR
ncbi:MAG: extracellular solute-binding protein [Lachnospiraceae bacterium]|nr:extracellular solute-binding protein [Lachnospiraceae bacterium]